MTHSFNVTCFRYDVGIFTAYGARIKQSKTTYPNPPKAVNNLPVRRDPRFIDKIFYDVVLFTNPENTQSYACYRSKDLVKAQTYLDNFILLCRRGYRYIDLSRIPDTPLRPGMFPPCPGPGPFIPPYDPYHPWFYKNDKFDCHIPDSEIDPRYLNDPRRNPYYDCFETMTREPRYAGGPKPLPPEPFCDECTINDVDCHNLPRYDGEITHFGPEPPCCPVPPPPVPYPPYPFRPEPPCPPIPPYPYPPIPPCPKPEPFVPPCPPQPREKIVVYFGDGGFTMGESVISDNIAEIAPNALRTMLHKNYHSTFPNMDPKDKIVVKKSVLECLLADTVFKTNMNVAGEWSFFMIPDRFFKYIKDFNWYYKDNLTDGLWKELDRSLAQTTFTIQDNGVRYYVNAIKLNGRYDMRFAKTGRDFNLEPSPDPVDQDNYVITLRIQNCNQNYIVTVQDLSVPTAYVKTLTGFINDEYSWIAKENHVYQMVIYAKSDVERDVPLYTTYFVAVPDANYGKGFCTWTSDEYDNTKSLIENGFVKVVDLVPPRTSSPVDYLILKDTDINP